MTRAEWYAQRYGGGWRTARKPFMCNQSLCLRRIEARQQYFDTCTPERKRICAECATTTIKEPA